MGSIRLCAPMRPDPIPKKKPKIECYICGGDCKRMFYLPCSADVTDARTRHAYQQKKLKS